MRIAVRAVSRNKKQTAYRSSVLGGVLSTFRNFNETDAAFGAVSTVALEESSVTYESISGDKRSGKDKIRKRNGTTPELGTSWARVTQIISQIQDGPSNPQIKFYILEIPQWTTDFYQTSTEYGDTRDNIRYFYPTSLNEHSGEIWLHRGFERLTYQQGHTMDPSEAQVILIPAYLHYWKRDHLIGAVKKPAESGGSAKRKQMQKKGRVVYHNGRRQVVVTSGRRALRDTEEGEESDNATSSYDLDVGEAVLRAVRFPTKPHVLLTPSVNPEEAHKTRLFHLVSKLKKTVNLFALAFERNKFWQNLKPDRLIPIPYVVRLTAEEETNDHPWGQGDESKRVKNFVFYSGNARKMSKSWGGCDRQMIVPLANRTDMHVKLVSVNQRLPQAHYMKFMKETAEYCLILCGDTVTSRSFSSSIVAGCIPIRVGSRLRGFCDPPCRKGWGWQVTNGLSHLPFADSIPWDLFPEVGEAEFTANPYQTLVKQVFEKYNDEKKKQLRYIMRRIRPGFIYGYDNPATSTKFGEAVPFIWSSIINHLNLTKQQQAPWTISG